MGQSTARGNRIYQQSDNKAVVVKASSTIPNVADPVLAEADANAQTAAVLVRGVEKLDVFIDVTAQTTATELYIKFRFSDKDAPNPATVTDWGYILVDDIASSTGISSVQEYMVKIDLDNVNGTANTNQARRYCTRIEQISGIWASAIVWSNGGSTTGSVTFVRHS